MIWEINRSDESTLYINKDIDLKIKVQIIGLRKYVFVNYKGHNLASAMLVWEFGEYLDLASIKDVFLECKKMNAECFDIPQDVESSFVDQV